MRRLIRLFRSAVSGRFVSKRFAKEHPAETVAEERWVDEIEVDDERP